MKVTIANQNKITRRYARYAEVPSCAPGWQTFKYGKLGELTENIRTFALPFESQTYTFKMQYEYDSWNRIQTMTYPDGEVVHYDYNWGGMLKKVYGTVKGDFLPQYPSTPHDSLVPLNLHGLGGQASLNSLPPVGDPVPLYDTHTYPYIDSIAYNEFELKSDVFYGNGTHALYAYDSLLRLLLLQSQTRTGDIMQNIVYTYDSVGNITGITNSAGMLPNGLGGAYSNSYMYDDLYRLASADGWWNSEDMAYQMQMAYHPNGRIQRKAARAQVHTQTDTSSSSQPVLYDYYYHYDNSQPNTLSSIEESEQQFEWDATGNMTRHVRGDFERQFCWDEQNRLLGVMDEGRQLSCYLYDANGDRTYKFTGEYTVQNQSGLWYHYYLLNTPTLYASPYLVATPKGYTKHYYAESERIASRIGGGGLQETGMEEEWNGELFASHEMWLDALIENLTACLEVEVRTAEDALKGLNDWHDSTQTETDCYWYHPDHLGSSSWVTDTGGTAVQHLHYLPWGEDFVNQRLNSFDGVRYTFSAKERDPETGLSYFGSRYYSSDLSIWLSVDPMSARYPSLSPYVYCADNPVRLVDPDGEEIYVGDNYYYQNGSLYYKGTTDVYVPTKGSFEEKALIALNTLRGTKQGWELMSPFEGETNKTDKKDKDIIIKEASKNPNTPGKVEVNDYNYSSDNDFLAATIYWNPEGVQLFQTLEPNATTDLGHEFSHAYDMATGVKYTIGKHDNCPLNEWQAVYRENMIREELGAPYRRGYKVLLHNKKDGTTTPYLTKMLTSGGMPFLP